MKAALLAARTLMLGRGLALAFDAAAAESKARDTLELERIMNELSRDMQRVADAIAREDWTTVARAAPRIARHRQPPAAEKAEILAFVGTRVAQFKAHDERTHEAAEALGTAAERQDGAAVIAAFQAVQTACYGCHQEFRRSFVEHFYGRR